MSARGGEVRTPPHSIEAEQSVLGGLLLDATAWDRVADVLRGDDFYRPDHRTIFDAIGQLAAQGQPCDAVGVVVPLVDLVDEIGHERADRHRAFGAPTRTLLGDREHPTFGGIDELTSRLAFVVEDRCGDLGARHQKLAQ